MNRLDDHIRRLQNRNYAWPIPWADVEALGRSEDCRLVAYLCPAGVPSIGWGETAGGITLDMRWTEDQCDAVFFKEVCRYTSRVESMLEKPANPNQLGAMVRFTYNIGFRRDKPTKAGFYWSSVRRLHNEGNYTAAARAFGLQNMYTDPDTGQKVVSKGLTARRAAESAAYTRPVEGTPKERIPQAVEGESSLSASPIARGGAVTVATGAVAGASSLADQLGGVSDTLASAKEFAGQVVDFIGLPPGTLGAVILVLAGYYVMKWRKKQRDEGFA